MWNMRVHHHVNKDNTVNLISPHKMDNAWFYTGSFNP
jgi:hypothetical protein